MSLGNLPGSYLLLESESDVIRLYVLRYYNYIHSPHVTEPRLADHFSPASTGGDTCDDSFQRNAFFVEERAELAMRERMLDDQRQALARERDMYTEAVLRLGREVSLCGGVRWEDRLPRLHVDCRHCILFLS